MDIAILLNEKQLFSSPIIFITLVSSSVRKQAGKILLISTYCGDLDNDNNYKTEKGFHKTIFLLLLSTGVIKESEGGRGKIIPSPTLSVSQYPLSRKLEIL